MCWSIEEFRETKRIKADLQRLEAEIEYFVFYFK